MVCVCVYMRVRLHAIHLQTWLRVVFLENLKSSIINSFLCMFFINNKTFYQQQNIASNQRQEKKHFISPFYGWGSTASRLEPVRWGSLLFITKLPEILGTYFIDLGKMNSWVDLGATQWFWTWDPWIGIHSNWETVD